MVRAWQWYLPNILFYTTIVTCHCHYYIVFFLGDQYCCVTLELDEYLLFFFSTWACYRLGHDHWLKGIGRIARAFRWCAYNHVNKVNWWNQKNYLYFFQWAIVVSLHVLDRSNYENLLEARKEKRYFFFERVFKINWKWGTFGLIDTCRLLILNLCQLIIKVEHVWANMFIVAIKNSKPLNDYFAVEIVHAPYKFTSFRLF